MFFPILMASFALFAYSQEFQTTNTIGGEVQNTFRIGGRTQRVRFFLSNSKNISNFLSGSKQIDILLYDPGIGASRSYLASSSASPISIGFGDFSEYSDAYGVIVNFPLLSCAAKLVDLVKIVGDTKKEEFGIIKINEINIFLKPVSFVEMKDYKLAIEPVPQDKRDAALNIQIPIVMPDSICALPTLEALENAFKDAVCKGIKMNYCNSR